MGGRLKALVAAILIAGAAIASASAPAQADDAFPNKVIRVIVGFAVAGQTLLDYLHVQLPALQAAGGLLLVLVALQLLTGKTDEPAEQGGTSNVALVPIGTPLLAGPGAIVATMLYVQRAESADEYLILAAAILAVMACVWLVLRFSGIIVRLLRPVHDKLASIHARFVGGVSRIRFRASSIAKFDSSPTSRSTMALIS